MKTKTFGVNWKRGFVGSPHESPDTTGRQATHSPLPFRYDDENELIVDSDFNEVASGVGKITGELIVASVNHADKLAEALTKVRLSGHPDGDVYKAVTDALAAYEADQ